MNYKLIAITSLLFLPVFPFALHAEPLSLKKAYDLALQRSEDLLITQEDIEQANARRRQALGAVLPEIHWALTTTIQDTSGVRQGSGGNGNATRRELTTSGFTIEQPIFQGFKERNAFRASKAEARLAQANLQRQHATLFLSVAEAFYRVLQLETFNKDLLVLLELTSNRVDDLRKRIRLGKSRSSEVLTVESSYAALKSQETTNIGNTIIARDQLGFLTGTDTRSDALVDELAYPAMVDSEENLLLLVSNRSDVRALAEDMEVKRYGVYVARADYFPGFDITGNYYTHRPGFQSEIDWDVSFNLDVPIYQGGGVKALVREAWSRYRQSELAHARLKRLAESEIRQARAALSTSIYEVQALDQSYQKAKKSYESQIEEYRLGLVNNLDVLQAMNSMQQAKAQYDTAYLQTKLDFLKLKVVTEELP